MFISKVNRKYIFSCEESENIVKGCESVSGNIWINTGNIDTVYIIL